MFPLWKQIWRKSTSLKIWRKSVSLTWVLLMSVSLSRWREVSGVYFCNEESGKSFFPPQSFPTMWRESMNNCKESDSLRKISPWQISNAQCHISYCTPLNNFYASMVSSKIDESKMDFEASWILKAHPGLSKPQLFDLILQEIICYLFTPRKSNNPYVIVMVTL